MLSIVIPADYRQLGRLFSEDPLLDKAEGLIKELNGVIDVAREFIVAIQGGIGEDFDDLKDYLDRAGHPWAIIHEREIVGIPTLINEAVKVAKMRYVAVVSPHVKITDQRWFGKMQSVFLRSPNPGMVAIPHKCLLKSSMPPSMIAKPYNHPADGLVLTTKNSLAISAPSGVDPGEGWAAAMSRKCAANGLARWIHWGVIFENV